VSATNQLKKVIINIKKYLNAKFKKEGNKNLFNICENNLMEFSGLIVYDK